MATIWDPKKNEQQQAVAPGQTSAPATQSAPGMLGAAGAPAKPQGSGQFTNLQSYIRANQGTEAGQKAGSAVLGASDSSMNEAKDATDKFGEYQAGNAVTGMEANDQTWLQEQANKKPEPVLQQPDIDALGGFGGGLIGSKGQIAVSNEKTRQANEDRDRFNQLFTKYGQGPGKYVGLNAAEVDPLANKAKEANLNAVSQSAMLKGDNSGLRSQYLRENIAKQPDYTAGQNNLDSFLLERNFGSQFDPKFQQNSAAINDRQIQINNQQQKLKTDIAANQAGFNTEAAKWAQLLSGAANTIGNQEQQAAASRSVASTVAQAAANDNAAAIEKMAQDNKEYAAKQAESKAAQDKLDKLMQKGIDYKAEMQRRQERAAELDRIEKARIASRPKAATSSKGF